MTKEEQIKDLFNENLPSMMTIKHRGAYPADPGSANNGKTCGDCNNYRSIEYHNKRYRKCAVIEHRWTHGAGTDILKKSPACRFFEYRLSAWDDLDSYGPSA